MARFIRSFLIVSASSLLACASPALPESSKQNNGTDRGPGVDLAGFVTQDPQIDMSVAPTGDMAKPPTGDMASMPKDMASPAHDMAMPVGCGSITYDGICSDPNTLVYCDSGMLVTVDCFADYGTGCEVVFGSADCYF